MKSVALMLSLCTTAVLAQAPSVERPDVGGTNAAIDERAIAALAKMTEHLKTLENFRITSESSRDEIVDTDMKIQKNVSSDITVRRPDRLRAHVRGDDQDLDFFYNGQTLTVFSSQKTYVGPRSQNRRQPVYVYSTTECRSNHVRPQEG